MAEKRTVAHIAAVLSGVSRRKLASGESLLLLVPALAEGSLVSADLAYRARLGYVAAELRLEEGPGTARIAQRLAFWLAREGGWSRALGGMTPAEAGSFRETLLRCDLPQREVEPAQWTAAVRRIFAAAGAPAPIEPLPGPELRLHVGGVAWHGFAYDAATRLLQVPSPLAPPAGDVLRLVVDAGGALRGARATVVAVRRPADASPGAPAGFTVALAEGSRDAEAVLAARCPRRAEDEGVRAEPRYAVVGGARVSDPGEELRYDSEDQFLREYMTNLSRGGAFVRTRRRREVGDRVDLHVRLPGREGLVIPATVAHRTEQGIGLEFDPSGEVEEALSAMVAGLAARPRRVLIVDDDALARSILADAFAQRGYEALTARDGDAGLRAIVDELLALDAVVTDVHMPGLSGDALVSAVRQAGGEAELVLVAMTAGPTAELVDRLTRAGADAVLSKAAGADRAVVAVEDALAARAAGRREAPPSRRAGVPGAIPAAAPT